MSDTEEMPAGRIGGVAVRAGAGRGAGRPPQPEGETHLFFACIIRWPDRRASTPARDRIKFNRSAGPHPVDTGEGELRSGRERAGASTSGDRALAIHAYTRSESRFTG